ncbi:MULTISPECIES: ArsR/SmtB family transcription factor [Stappiaceae]|jgi:ArsR family transcriptional regulator|uniref:Putative transcriptional regulator n=1 Tax=Roseibium alexandrii (strain DSM 17067 / NCIMB 14079 / DFL-11) TaxID=244592 RepID=A0A5E8H291_ROSAD|nr:MULTISPECIES: metalloregulator ArsR/SmtB family transcription factor [Stappiaceae]EEE45439.1 putative transcriptional regulator [Roseibium alexandrii DFL-11]MBO9421193.1 helix-turn-helix transcriptional regulator [Labrenzia sp. R4_2]
MEKEDALRALAALGQETRLDVFRLLVKAGKEGMAAGAISDALSVRPNTLSTHLSALSRSGLVHAERDGRSIHYRADLSAMGALTTYLLQDCCGGNPEMCAPIMTMLGDSVSVEKDRC